MGRGRATRPPTAPLLTLAACDRRPPRPPRVIELGVMNQIFRMGDSIDFHSPAVHMNVRLRFGRRGEGGLSSLSRFLDDWTRVT